MSIPFHAIGEQDLLLAILTKMSAVPFARIRQANKEILRLVQKKKDKFRVRATGCFDVARGNNVTLSGFVLDVISLKDSSPDRPRFLPAPSLVECHKFLQKWWSTAKVLQFHPGAPLRTEALNMLRPATIIAAEGLLSLVIMRFPLDLLVCNGMPRDHDVRRIRKLLFKPVERRSVTITPDYLRKLTFPGSRYRLLIHKIIQASNIKNTASFASLESFAAYICPSSGVSDPARKTKYIDGNKVVVVEGTKLDGLRYAVGAFWDDGTDEERNFCCKIYLGFDGEITKEMLNPAAIYGE